MISNDLKENSHISSKTEVGWGWYLPQKKSQLRSVQSSPFLGTCLFWFHRLKLSELLQRFKLRLFAKKGRNHPEKWENSFFFGGNLFSFRWVERPSTAVFFQKLCLFVFASLPGPTSPSQVIIETWESHTQPARSRGSTWLLSLLECLSPPSPFWGYGSSGKFQWKLPGKSTKRSTSTTKLPKAKKTWIFGCHDSFLIWKKNGKWKKHDQLTQLIHHFANLDRKKIHSWSSTGLLPDCCWSLRRSQWIDWMSGANFQCKKWIPPFFPLENLGNFKLVVFCFFLGGVGMQKKGPPFFFEHQHITALRELLTSCSGSTQSYFLFLACCNNWCNWCQTSSGCVSNQSRIFSNTRGHGPFSCSIRIWAHANDPVNWRVDSGSDSALSRFCCQLSLASNC